MIHWHGCKQDTAVSPRGRLHGPFECPHKHSVWIAPEGVIQDSKTEAGMPFMISSQKSTSSLLDSLLPALLAVATSLMITCTLNKVGPPGAQGLSASTQAMPPS